jgi:hypothetical protein
MVSAMEQGTGGGVFIFDNMEANTGRRPTTPIIGKEYFLGLLPRLGLHVVVYETQNVYTAIATGAFGTITHFTEGRNGLLREEWSFTQEALTPNICATSRAFSRSSGCFSGGRNKNQFSFREGRRCGLRGVVMASIVARRP